MYLLPTVMTLINDDSCTERTSASLLTSYNCRYTEMLIASCRRIQQTTMSSQGLDTDTRPDSVHSDFGLYKSYTYLLTYLQSRTFSVQF